MSNFADIVKRALKTWVRPLLIPIARFCIRYSPHERIRRLVWIHLIVPFFEHAKHSFVVDTQFGASITGDTEDLIQRYIYYFGVWEPNLTEFLETRLRDGDVFVDVGANIGYFTLLASRLVGRSGKVIAIEASPMICARLMENIKRNQVVNVDVMNIAAADRSGSVRMYLASDSNIGETSIFAERGGRYECDVSANSLDSLLAPRDVANTRLVKIDVEGGEWPVIAGMSGLLRGGRPDLEVAVEINPESLEQFGKSVEDLCRIFSQLGFYPYCIENDYSGLSYTSRRAPKLPVRIRSPISKQTDIIFSRIDADCLQPTATRFLE